VEAQEKAAKAAFPSLFHKASLSEIGEAFRQNFDQLVLGVQGLCQRATRATCV
jgi:hypothetical protein